MHNVSTCVRVGVGRTRRGWDSSLGSNPGDLALPDRPPPYTPSTLAYSLSNPGSIKQACPRMRIALLPTSQKNVDTGEAIHNKGSPACQLRYLDVR